MLWSPNYIPAATATAKGDLLVATASGTIVRKAVGSNDQLLIADSAQSDNLRYATPAEVRAALSLNNVTNDAQTKQSTLTAKGDIYVATGTSTVVRKAVGATNGDPLVVDSAQTDGLRYDGARGAEMTFARDVAGILCCTSWDLGSSITYDMVSTARTVQWVMGRLPAGTVISNFKIYSNLAMIGGVATLALYESATLNSASWSRIGSNTTVTSLLTAAAGKNTIGYSATVSGSDAWIRAQLVLTTAPSTYPKMYATFPLVDTAIGGHTISALKNATAAPGSTMDPSTGWTSYIGSPICALT